MARRDNAHLWLAEPLMLDPSYLARPMFGCEACYLNGLLVLVLADTEEPWNGLLIPTERPHHPELLAEFPTLAPHPVLPKWLYISAERDDFERVAHRIVAAIGKSDPRFGVVPGERARAKRESARKGARRKQR